jgi:hypothetical protein
MKRLSARPAALVGALLLFAAGPARADFTYSNWSYNWTASVPSTVPSSGGTASVSFGLSQGAGAAQINVGNFSANGGATPDAFGTSYSLNLALTDNADPSHPNTSLTWQGTVSGSVGPNGWTVSNNFAQPLTQSTTFDGHTYTVTLQPQSFNIPAPNTSTGQGPSTQTDIIALVSVTNAGGGGPPVTVPPVSQTPEPSTLLLAATAAALGLARQRKAARRLLGVG